MSHHHTYLISHRKRLTLSQDDVAFLLGTTDGTRVSRYERAVRMPDLHTALALEIILQKPAAELFAGLYRRVRRNVRARARELLNEMAMSPPTRRILRKRQLLTNFINSKI